MKCPTCQVNLSMTERNGIEIDYCPECRGVWLDKGELDKIIERSMQTVKSPSPLPFVERAHYPRVHDYHGKKKKGFLGDLFDF